MTRDADGHPTEAGADGALCDAIGPEDLDAIRALCLEYAAHLGLDLETQDFSREIATLPGAYARPRGRLLLARIAGAPAGCAALKPLSDDACEMKRLFVRPAYRGCKIGLRLVERLIVEGRGAGYRWMRLDTIPDRMPRAVALYRACGFVDIPPYWDNPLPGVRYMQRAL